MKSVLVSIQPKWCELIANGNKTVEVRKTAPKLETPFKVYIYQTKKKWVYRLLEKLGLYQGKVIGEFVCARISQLNSYCLDGEDRLKDTTCLDDAELMDYVGYLDKTFYLWHISDLRIYDKPKELENFLITRRSGLGLVKLYLSRPPQSWCYVEVKP